jgi:protocatechuate 3,4-dioxygenase beta subunit
MPSYVLFLRALTAALFSTVVLIGGGAQALITGDYGNKPIQDRDWPEGSLIIANDKSRLGWWEGPPFGGGEYTFLYRGDAKAFNKALELLAEINWPVVELHVHAGPHEDFWLVNRGPNQEAKKQRDPRIDWSFTVWSPRNYHHLYNDPRSHFSADRPAFRQSLPPPRIDVYLGGGLIDWNHVTVPDKVRVVGDPARALKGEGPRVRLTVYDIATSKPVSGAIVTLIGTGKDGQKHAGKKMTDERGAISFDNLEPGHYDLQIAGDEYATRSLGWEEYRKGDDKALSITLSRSATVVGRVLNNKGEPIEKASIRPFVVLGPDGRGYTQPQRPQTMTDAAGRFELQLPAGFVQLSAQATGLYHSWTEVLPVGERHPAIEPAQPVIIRMAATSTVTLKVTDENEAPVAGQNVSLEPTGNPIGKWSGSATTDVKGAAVLKGVPPGVYRITDRSYPKKDGPEIEVVEGQAVEINVSW